MITSAFLNHAIAAAKHLHIDELPMVVPPHPLYDLAPADLRDLARAAYPLIVQQLTTKEPFVHVARVNYQRPSERQARFGSANTGKDA